MAVTAPSPHSSLLNPPSPELPTGFLGPSTLPQRPASSTSSLASDTFLGLGYPLTAEASLLAVSAAMGCGRQRTVLGSPILGSGRGERERWLSGGWGGPQRELPHWLQLVLG